jgi:hypothetical protein
MTLFVVSPKHIHLEDNNRPRGEKIIQVAEASLRVCWLAPSVYPMNTLDSLDIYHSDERYIKKMARP